MVFTQSSDTLKLTSISNYHYPKNFWNYYHAEAAENYFSVFKTIRKDTIETQHFNHNAYSGLKLNTAGDTQFTFMVFNHDTLIVGPFNRTFDLKKDGKDTMFVSRRTYTKNKLSKELLITVSEHDSLYRIKDPYTYFQINRSKTSWLATKILNDYKSFEYGSNHKEDVKKLIPQFFIQRNYYHHNDPGHALSSHYFKEYQGKKVKTYALMPYSRKIEVEDGLIEKLIEKSRHEYSPYGYGCGGGASVSYTTNLIFNENDSLLVLDGNTDFYKLFLVNGFEDYVPSNCSFNNFLNLSYILTFQNGVFSELNIEAGGSNCTIERAYLIRGTNFFFDELVNKKIGINYKVLERNSTSGEWMVKEEKIVPAYSGKITIECTWPW